MTDPWGEGEALVDSGVIVRGSSHFMFEDTPVDVIRKLLDKEANIEQMALLWAAARDINTGLPLRGEDYLEWLFLPAPGTE